MNRRLQMPCYAPTGVFIGEDAWAHYMESLEERRDRERIARRRLRK